MIEFSSQWPLISKLQAAVKRIDEKKLRAIRRNQSPYSHSIVAGGLDEMS